MPTMSGHLSMVLLVVWSVPGIAVNTVVTSNGALQPKPMVRRVQHAPSEIKSGPSGLAAIGETGTGHVGLVRRVRHANSEAKTEHVGLVRRVRHANSEAKSEHAGLGGDANLKKYHTGEQIISSIKALKDGCAVPLSYEMMADSASPSQGELFVVRLGEPTAGKKMLVVANEHARELITGETALRFVQKVCLKVPGGAASLMKGQQSSRSQIVELLNNVQYTVVPVVNKAGRALVESGEATCQRMTTREEGNVDLNRNMDVDWGKGATQDWGPKPFSTYQARILRDLAAKEQPLAFVDLHSGARSLMTSWGYRPATDPDYADQKASLAEVKKRHCPDCEMGSNRVVINYPNPGENIDHMYAKQKIKYSSLWEVYHGTGGCLQMFNPPDSALDENVNNWSEALITHGNYIHKSVKTSERSNPGSLLAGLGSEALLQDADGRSATLPDAKQITT